MSFGGGSGGGGSIATGSDVALSSPTNGQVLTYNTTLGKWQNANATGGGAVTLAQLPTGMSFDVIYDGTNWKYGSTTITARPTSRTDLTMQCVNPIDATVPSWAIDGDLLLRVGGS